MAKPKPNKQYSQVFLDSYNKKFANIIWSRKGPNFAFCSICRCNLNIAHGGINDVKVHIKSKKHSDASASADKSADISTLFKKINTNDEDDVINAECLFTAFIIEHNLPLAIADHAGPLFRKMFPKCEIAKRYGCARTKTTSIIKEMALSGSKLLSSILVKAAFSISTDGSNDNNSKLYPTVVTYYNCEREQIESTLLAVTALEGDATGENIGNMLITCLASKEIPITNCIALGADNANVMIGTKLGVASVMKKMHEEIIVMGCLCHLIHLTAEKAAKTLPIQIDEILIDIFYYLKRSTKRMDKLKEFQVLHDVEVQKILKHCCTRWLSLERCLKRLLEQWKPLISFFLNQIPNSKTFSSISSFQIPKMQNRSQPVLQDGAPPPKKSKICKNTSSKSVAQSSKSTVSVVQSSESTVLTREERLFMFLTSDVNKAFCLFLDFIIPTFDDKNCFLQSQEPKIHILKSVLLEFLKDLLTKFVRAIVIKEAKSLLDVKYHFLPNQKEDADLVIGSATSKIVKELKPADQRSFYYAVKKYYTTACDYIYHKFPLKNDILIHAEVADTSVIENKSFSDLEFFIEKFPVILSKAEEETVDSAKDKLHLEFCSFQMDNLPQTIKNERIDKRWALIGQLKTPDGKLKYGKLANAMLGILTIPHSNADCERIFSQVRKTRTEFRPSMSDKTLENLLLVKSSQKGMCHEQMFDKNFLKAAKSAASNSLKS